MATILVNKFFHEMNGSVNVSLEPLNEVYFGDNDNLREITNQFKILKEDLLPTAEFQELSLLKLGQVEEGIYRRCINLIWKHPSMRKITKLIQQAFGFANVVRQDMPTSLLSFGMATDNLKGSVSNYRDTFGSVFFGPEEVGKSILNNSVLDPKRSRLLSRNNLDKDKVDKIMQRYTDQVTKAIQTYRQTFKNSKDEDFIDDYGNINGSKSDVASRALIITKNRIGFNPDKVKVIFNWYINPFFIILAKPRELTAILLHEIGHNFAAFLVSDIPIELANTPDTPSRRAHEIFADRFAALHGYGFDLNNMALYTTQLSNLDKEQTKKRIKTDKNTSPSYNWAQYMLHDEHPFVINDIKAMLNQLYYTKKTDSTLTRYQKLHIDREIDKLTRLLNQYKAQHIYADALSRHQKRTAYDKRAQKIINPAKMDKAFLKYEIQ